MTPTVSEEKILQVCRILDSFGVPYLVIGGVAQSVWGDPRLTYDLDFIVFLKDAASLDKFVEHGRKEGLSFDGNRAAETFRTHGGFVGRIGDIDLDFLVAGTAYEAAMYERRRLVPYAGVDIPFPSPEDLILLKLVAGREKDILDMKNVVRRQGEKLDRTYLRYWADQFQSKRPEKPFKKLLNDVLENR